MTKKSWKKLTTDKTTSGQSNAKREKNISLLNMYLVKTRVIKLVAEIGESAISMVEITIFYTSDIYRATKVSRQVATLSISAFKAQTGSTKKL